MKRALTRLITAAKTARQLGPRQSFWYALYQAGLRSGYYRLATPAGASALPANCLIRSPFALPDPSLLRALVGDQVDAVIEEANEILDGKVRLFGGRPVPLNLIPKDVMHHWTHYEGRPSTWGVEDIKLLWEPARFGWAYALGRAYRLSCDERYPEAFWKYFEVFQAANPVNQGPNWSSAQEAALRLVAFLFAAGVFSSSPHSTPERMRHLACAVADHARRIPPTLSYARAQNNNHLVSEALGLYAAGSALPEHPQASAWRRTGWSSLNQALRGQIENDGTYVQHSMNYHRLMLHAALLAALFGRPYPGSTLRKLASAAIWLLAQVDPGSGQAPNLGNNDGSLILPLAPGGSSDYRPAAQAAGRAFLQQTALLPGPWDELGLWLGQAVKESSVVQVLPRSPGVHRLGDHASWATLRAARYHSRPAHADQLHVEIWWDGENIARDAGTFRYTAQAPWDNALAETPIHNTVAVDAQNQMTRAGRFLWLDWAQAKMLETPRFLGEAISASQDGYRRLGVIHRRALARAGPCEWRIIDDMLPDQPPGRDPARQAAYRFRLHWLLPDWPWMLDGETLILQRPGGGKARLVITAALPDHAQSRVESVSLVRAGEALSGPQDVSPVMGWFSPTYNLKAPALSFSVTVQSPLPLALSSTFIFEEGNNT